MTRAALVAPVRTAVGRFGGSLKDVSAVSLATTVIKETVARSGIDPELIEEVAMGQSTRVRKHRASAGGLRSTRVCRSRLPVSRPTAAAAPACRLW